MKSVNTWLEQRPEPPKWDYDFIKVTQLRTKNTAVASAKPHKQEFKPRLIPLTLNNTPSIQFVQKLPQTRLDTGEEGHSQVKYYLSLIDDPLWKKVCCYVEDMMGPLSAITVWECKLGSFSVEENNIEINCKTEEAAQFLTRYAFVILGGLRPYFPALKKLKVSQINFSR